jgi:transposase
VKGGKRTLIRWHQRWDGTAASLKQQQRSGRPCTLTPAEVSRHIRAPILAANRAHRAIHYSDIWRQVETKTGKKITLRTVQRTGKETLAIKERTTRKRTQAECQCNQ